MGGDIAMGLNQIIRKVFLNSSSFVLLINSNFGSDATTFTTEDAEDYATPKRTTEHEVRTQLLALTEGQRVAQKQAEVLTYKRLRNVLGEEFLKFATKYFATTNEADIEAKWNAIFEPNIPYNDANKRNILTGVSKLALNASNSSSELLMLQAELFKLQQQTKEVPLTRIEESTKSCFESIFPGSRVTTSWKRGGDQLGCVAEVTLSSDQKLKYYVKTHSEGLKSGHSSAAKLVNPAELLVYKVLEELGVGCQSHFFGRDGQNLYIATLDANVEGPFKEYAHFKDAQEKNIQELLWGALTRLPNDAQFSDTQHHQAEALVTSDPKAQNFVREATKLDLLARIMGLEDFQTNPNNYGFTMRENGVFTAKAIDFRVQNKKVEELEKDYRSFNAFLNGNGEYNYSSTGSVMYYALTKRQQHLRVHEALQVIDTVLSDFIEKVDVAHRSVSQTLSNIPMVEDDQISIQSNLGKYSEIIKANFLMFKDHLQKYR